VNAPVSQCPPSMRADMRRSAAKRLEEAVLRELGTLSRGVDEGVLTRDEGRLIGVIVESVRILRRKIEEGTP